MNQFSKNCASIVVSQNHGSARLVRRIALPSLLHIYV
jgi:hypothetical protein